ncbi:MAG: ROK family transcriptional regulator [Verrucomicrobiota bacterium]|nr:ROK family transcriptional regulator [Verrucomicrobiota bacterium]
MPRRAIRTKHQIVAGVEAELLKRIRARGGLSRVELAHELHLAPSTAGIYVDRLLRDGFLVEREKAGREQGRPPTLLVPNPDGGRFVGVDFEARSIMATAFDFSQQAMTRTQRAIREGDSVDRVLARIEEVVRAALEGDKRPLLGIGVGVPGVIDPADGVARSYEFIPGWKDVPLAQRLAHEFRVPVHSENNIRSMAMAELWFGQGLGLRNFVCLGVRTGIGVGVVANGHLLCGQHGGAGQIGKWPAPGAGANGSKTAAQTLESVASLKAILSAASATAKTGMNFAGLRAAAESGDRKILNVLARAAQVHGWAIHQLQLLFDPQRIILVGPLAELGSAFLDPLIEAVRHHSTAAPTEIVSSTLGQFSGAFGAAALALHHWKPAR